MCVCGINIYTIINCNRTQSDVRINARLNINRLERETTSNRSHITAISLVQYMYYILHEMFNIVSVCHMLFLVLLRPSQLRRINTVETQKKKRGSHFFKVRKISTLFYFFFFPINKGTAWGWLKICSSYSFPPNKGSNNKKIYSLKLSRCSYFPSPCVLQMTKSVVLANPHPLFFFITTCR